MIFDTLSNFHCYEKVHPFFRLVSRHLKSNKFGKMNTGRINLEKKIFVIIDKYLTKDIKDKFIECHKKFIDIQVIIKGKEKIGICSRKECKATNKYDKEKDLEKLKGEMDFITLKNGYFAVFFPQDAHMPGLIDGKAAEIKKIVFKIPVL